MSVPNKSESESVFFAHYHKFSNKHFCANLRPILSFSVYIKNVNSPISQPFQTDTLKPSPASRRELMWLKNLFLFVKLSCVTQFKPPAIRFQNAFLSKTLSLFGHLRTRSFTNALFSLIWDNFIVVASTCTNRLRSLACKFHERMCWLCTKSIRRKCKITSWNRIVSDFLVGDRWSPVFLTYNSKWP